MSFIISAAISNTYNSKPVNNVSCKVPLWNNSDAATLALYCNSYVDSLLQNVPTPYNALFDVSHDNSVCAVIDKFYNETCDCIVKASDDLIFHV